MKKKIETICDKRVEELMERKRKLQEKHLLGGEETLRRGLKRKQLTERIEEAQIIKNLIIKEL